MSIKRTGAAIVGLAIAHSIWHATEARQAEAPQTSFSPSALLTEARTAIGGDARLRAVKTLVMKGSQPVVWIEARGQPRVHS
jgi:hypothetical protein